MSAETKPRTIMVSDMLAKGIEAVEATCHYCGHVWSVPIGFLPERTTLEKVGRLLACPTCRRGDVDVEPKWPDQGPIQ